MGAIKTFVAMAAVVCGLSIGVAPVASSSTDGILNGTYDVMGPNSTLDRWVITTNCTELAAGCEANIQSSWVGGEAVYRGFYTWTLTLKGLVPICPDKSPAKGMMVFQWNAKTLQGQLSTMQRGFCQMTRPGDGQMPITLVKVET